VGNDDGSYIYDLEMLETLHDILDQLLNCKKIIIKLNHREIVNNILTYAHVPVDKIQTVCSTLDKLDKKTWSEISTELTDKKISIDCITILKDLMLELFDKTNNDKLKILIDKNILSDSALNNMMTIMSFINLMSYDNFILEPFLIRGMDYYTGIIYEAQYIDLSVMPFTIAAGGRYDDMMEKFCNVGKLPSIGMSLGIERIAKILEQTFEMTEIKYDVYIASIGKNMAPYKIQIASELRKHNIVSTMSHMNDQKMRHQMDIVFEKKIPIMIIVGSSELETNTVTIKNISTKTQFNVPYKLMIETVKLHLN
jgi:histidyl-tRNA synthetase